MEPKYTLEIYLHFLTYNSPNNALEAVARDICQLAVPILHNSAPVHRDEGGGGTRTGVSLQDAQLALLLLHLLPEQDHPFLKYKLQELTLSININYRNYSFS